MDYTDWKVMDEKQMEQLLNDAVLNVLEQLRDPDSPAAQRGHVKSYIRGIYDLRDEISFAVWALFNAEKEKAEKAAKAEDGAPEVE